MSGARRAMKNRSAAKKERRKIAAFGNANADEARRIGVRREDFSNEGNFMLKTLIVAFIVAAIASLTPALAQMPAANPPAAAESDQAAPSAQPEKPKAAHKKHNKKHAAKRAKAKTETENPGTEKKEGDTKQ